MLFARVRMVEDMAFFNVAMATKEERFGNAGRFTFEGIAEASASQLLVTCPQALSTRFASPD